MASSFPGHPAAKRVRRDPATAERRDGVGTTYIDDGERTRMAREGGNTGGIGLGGILAIIGIVVMIIGSFWLGLIILLVGLVAFGGFARGKWY
jgi:hypothetical protein